MFTCHPIRNSIVLVLTTLPSLLLFLFFFFNDTATTEIYTLSLHDALPILERFGKPKVAAEGGPPPRPGKDRKSTRLNSSHGSISYAVFCLKKKNNRIMTDPQANKKTDQPTLIF